MAALSDLVCFSLSRASRQLLVRMRWPGSMSARLTLSMPPAGQVAPRGRGGPVRMTPQRPAGHDSHMPVPLFEHRPTRCPFGHSLARGMPQQAGWMPCICAPAREAAEHRRGMGHLWVVCDTCHAEHRHTTFYEPPHDIRHHPRAPGRPRAIFTVTSSGSADRSPVARRGVPLWGGRRCTWPCGQWP